MKVINADNITGHFLYCFHWSIRIICLILYFDTKHSFATAKRLAKIDDLHFHDLRRTAITRWLQQGTSLAFAGKFAGHSQLQTTMKHYTATDAGMIQEMNERMNAFNSPIEDEKSEKSDFLN